MELVPILFFWKIAYEFVVPIAKVSECYFPVYVIVLFPDVPFTDYVIAKHVFPLNYRFNAVSEISNYEFAAVLICVYIAPLWALIWSLTYFTVLNSVDEIDKGVIANVLYPVRAENWFKIGNKDT